MNKLKKKTYIIGYSLDSAMFARELASKRDIEIVYLQTGTLGHPLDETRDYISYENVLQIKALGVDVEFKKLTNSTFVYIPFNDLKFVNTRNGLISYPLNKSSFDSAEEWEQVEFCLSTIGEFRENLENVNNFINIYKNFFPKWLYDSLLKHMGINKWGGIRQSKFTREGLAREIDLSCLDGSNTGSVYRPVNGYEQLCKTLLDHPNITMDTIDIRKVHSILTERNKMADIVLADNRVDMICNYTYGAFDRIEFMAEHSNEQNLEEFYDISEGIVFTPTKDYWCISNELGDIVKVRSRYIDELRYCKQSVIPTTTHNRKLYSEYQKMLTLYSGKILYLSSQLNTTIK
jgi:UDP-galactopyranose mutase